jgi:hypothetical protein
VGSNFEFGPYGIEVRERWTRRPSPWRVSPSLVNLSCFPSPSGCGAMKFHGQVESSGSEQVRDTRGEQNYAGARLRIYVPEACEFSGAKGRQGQFADP